MQVRNKVKEKNALNDIIESLNTKINQKDTIIKKHEDELVECKEHKNFLDVMAIQAGKKQYNPKRKVTTAGTVATSTEVVIANRGSNRNVNEPVGSTFLTQTKNVSMKPSSQGLVSQMTASTKPGTRGTVTQGTLRPGTVAIPEESILEAGPDYEDDDFEEHWNKKTLLDYLDFLEDDNLFKIKIIQDEEVNLEAYLKKKEKNIQVQQEKVDDVNGNI